MDSISLTTSSTGCRYVFSHFCNMISYSSFFAFQTGCARKLFLSKDIHYNLSDFLQGAFLENRLQWQELDSRCTKEYKQALMKIACMAEDHEDAIILKTFCSCTTDQLAVKWCRDLAEVSSILLPYILAQWQIQTMMMTFSVYCNMSYKLSEAGKRKPKIKWSL
ncbi:hypothetical protein BCR43DRAFT_495082 [Syncephalastrum racemosum]|uniref:Uncharacterized protein n=1 Tax=Syncephalastrum racemosum TaxID=13706 RepID=A0A1X2H938_SYNRA|nr:hypothetical protein BCR43DRAFT_495082 [Syncephalastrum racemosum]